MPPFQDQLPHHAVCTQEQAALFAEHTKNGRFTLHTSEKLWRDRQPFLQSHGYLLRPRYHPNWSPSWLGTLRNPFYCEDCIPSSINFHVLDATRESDNCRVTIKVVSKETQEIDIGRSLTTDTLMQDQTNHCVPIVDVLPDPLNPAKVLLIMPYLSPFDNPEFTAVGEVLEFIRQTLEGIEFMHRQGVAHRDLAAANIMMDSRPLYPHGHHPVRRQSTIDALYDASHVSRIDHPVRYYLIDFGLSTRFAEGQSPLVTGKKGRDQSAPEFEQDEPYDAYKLDMYTLGHLYFNEFVNVYEGLDFLLPLIAVMVQDDTTHRVTSAEALDYFNFLVAEANLSPSSLRWRLTRQSEPASTRMI